MQVHTKMHPTDDMITLRLKVHRHNAPLVRRYAESVESEEERTYTVSEVFPEYIGKESHGTTPGGGETTSNILDDIVSLYCNGATLLREHQIHRKNASDATMH